MAPDKPAAPAPDFEFADQFYEAYANNVYLEASAWDLKLIFGQLDQSGQLIPGERKIKIVEHSAITVPWTQAKLMLFWLRGQIEAHELVNGKVHLPPALIPPPIPPLTEEMKKSDPKAEAVHAIFSRLRDEFISSLGTPQ
jgi:hypothetical protein